MAGLMRWEEYYEKVERFKYTARFVDWAICMVVTVLWVVWVLSDSTWWWWWVFGGVFNAVFAVTSSAIRHEVIRLYSSRLLRKVER